MKVDRLFHRRGRFTQQLNYSNMIEQQRLEDLTESAKQYLNTNIELLKFEATERTSVIGSGLISRLLVGMVSLLFVLFISIAAGFYLSELLGDSYSGFLIVAGFYFLLGLILIIGRKKLIETPLRDKFIRSILSNN
ncbi:Putative Holin-X, holin superfamily III [Williamwhitmania taraxaci]|uniref:Putative Holin-X, holin superfamily III n=2 Tax=Williamwhitmania taraxaci TaxID=1640674 RepID=A0A1G6R2J9_9BACT|nr:Putative Holin-X, holin superfamily III [Williamwhitmania taraxaci]